MSAILLATASVGVAACSSGHRAGTAAAIRANLSSTTLVTLDGFGVPVEFDHVACEGPSPSQAISCVATTAYEPSGQVVGSFRLDRSGAACPGVLRISIDGAPLTAVKTDPCR